MSRVATLHALIGKQFGKLIVTEVGRGTGKDSSHYYSFCVCDCGRETIIRTDRLIKKTTEACGCMESGYKKPRQKSGESQTRLYSIWSNMLARCYNPKDSHYKYYAGKGVYVDQNWRTDFLSFKQWALANGYAADLTLDRINGKLSYTPDNCRWTTYDVQYTNKSNLMQLRAFGETKTLQQWEKDPRCVVNAEQLRHRVKRYKWSVELALTTPLMTQYSHKEIR